MLFRPRSINVTFKTGDSTVLRTSILSLYLYWCRRQSHISGSIIRFLSFHRDSTNHIVQSRESLLVAFFSAILRIGRQIGNVTYKATVCQRIKTNANTRVQKKATQETMRWRWKKKEMKKQPNRESLVDTPRIWHAHTCEHTKKKTNSYSMLQFLLPSFLLFLIRFHFIRSFHSSNWISYALLFNTRSSLDNFFFSSFRYFFLFVNIFAVFVSETVTKHAHIHAHPINSNEA